MSPRTGLAAAWTSVLLVSAAQLAMHWGMTRLPAICDWAWATWPRGAVAWVAGGVVAYAVSLGFWLRALSQLPLGRAYGLLGLSYALVYILSASLPFFDTHFSAIKTVGVGLIVAGVWLMNTCGASRDCPVQCCKESQ
ncbi:4-amino-4-deoxy-L-arabinose-phosphoundecaprenol flippase subunit ArnF [Pseudomonas sp. K1(2024)]|uniref:4-amino-4-deoxy-L-arabinose-phosphoundecaprenol flippase subunit ArnF n=2 Tax=Pseudomonas TaxID=286 RepID=A0AAI8PA91_9PSED|nr:MULTISPECIES: 4-amino-4-deoxy-L-arabinose-phosphoundecaprenol flippase subunit ArnF [Pseudomonas]AXO88663.1 4-amino-4-deoxy-L-arabinose-phosphoundecaprenol flippase subunit ArnF [Pseudomonas parafulva]MDO7902157.1 4-amino-4-deoxy-L-arabinose-phosphoundecaprenol flippase subunit ArnF [Pseudomonas sp. K13]